MSHYHIEAVYCCDPFTFNLITDFLYFPGCFLEQTIMQPVLPSERRRARLLLAAQGRAWTLSACPLVTPAAPQTARDSPPLTPPTPSKTRWVTTLWKRFSFWAYIRTVWKLSEWGKRKNGNILPQISQNNRTLKLVQCALLLITKTAQKLICITEACQNDCKHTTIMHIIY